MAQYYHHHNDNDDDTGQQQQPETIIYCTISMDTNEGKKPLFIHETIKKTGNFLAINQIKSNQNIMRLLEI
ncbi:hypothetical protein DERF_006421 [Dermatophagoides farinae]|uniref:Uncharacterized protein n=1 Tax=Dermatophagoides farinae TaxID=6954 RepID=A0A922L9N1_DERFA|nr:hypothetical protein DERF_006421 [Dermatophagoides farinae]